MTKAEEQNMWGRLVVLEKIVAKLVEKKVQPSFKEAAPDPHYVEPPRDRYGAEVGRPGM